MTKNINDGLNHDLGNDFILRSLQNNLKMTVKNKYMEVCKMCKEELKKEIVDQGGTVPVGVYPELKLFTELVFCAQADLKSQLNVDVNIVAMSFDAETFGSLDWVIQYCLCSDKIQYKRMISKYGATGFMRVYPMPGIREVK